MDAREEDWLLLRSVSFGYSDELCCLDIYHLLVDLLNLLLYLYHLLYLLYQVDPTPVYFSLTRGLLSASKLKSLTPTVALPRGTIIQRT